jgi:dihydrolipoamide dehydrogenase
MTSERKVDVAIIGAGTAGQSAAREVSKVTERFVLVDDEVRGTTCAYAGCMPSKVLIQVSADFERRKVLEAEGITGGRRLKVDGARVMSHVRELRDGFASANRKGLTKLGDRLIKGRARLVEPDLVEVGSTRVRANGVVLAAGSSPIVPGPWQELSDRLITTESLFELQKLPARMGVVGLGPVGVEMGQALARLGVEVYGFEMTETVAGLTDPVARKAAVEELEKDMSMTLGAPAELSDHSEGVAIRASGRQTVVDAVLVTMGRRPNTAGLGLEEIGAPIEKDGSLVYDPTTCKVEGLPIYVAGDFTGSRPILHEASDEGRIAGFNSVRKKDHCFERRVATSIVFCDPNIAMVGRTHSELDESEVAVGEMDFSKQNRGRIMMDARGVARIYASKSDGRLVGAELVIPQGEHIAHLLSWALGQRLSVFDLLSQVFYHPTLEEGLRRAIRDAAKKTGLERPPAELAICDSCSCV